MGVGPATASRAEQWCAVARGLQAGVEGPFPPLQLTMLWNLCVDMTSSGAPVLDRLLLPTGLCGARQPLFYASRASRLLCFKEGRYGSRSPSYAVAQRGAQRAVQDIVPYLRMLVVGDIRARSYATGQQSLDDETTV